MRAPIKGPATAQGAVRKRRFGLRAQDVARTLEAVVRGMAETMVVIEEGPAHPAQHFLDGESFRERASVRIHAPEYRRSDQAPLSPARPPWPPP